MRAPTNREKLTRHIVEVPGEAGRQFAIRCPGRPSLLCSSWEEVHLALALLNLNDAPPCIGRFDEVGPHDEPCKGVAYVHPQRGIGAKPAGYTDGHCMPCAKRLWLPPWDS